MQYPLDFDTTGVVSPAAQAIRLLARTHQLGIALETQHWQYRPSAGYRLLHGELTEYLGRWPRRQQAIVSPQPLTTFTGLRVQQGALFRDSHYQDAVWFDRYDGRGNPLAVHRPSAFPTAFLWQAATGDMLASVQNANYEQIAYTSFEPDATGRWLYDSVGTHRQLGGRTGSWAFRAEGSSGVVRPNLPAGAYELLWWQQGAAPLLVRFNNALVTTPQQLVATAPGDWRQVRLRFQAPDTGTLGVGADVGSSVLLDEVRLHPVGARMTSFTHAPLVGETSQTGPDGRTVTYEYDALGRLVRTRDEQGRILGQQQYHYAGQQ